MDKELLSENESDNIVEESTGVSVLKDNVLNTLPIGTTVYVPYISIIDDIYEVRECIIESIGDIVENGVITLYYNCKLSNTDSGDGMTLNILANVSTSFEEAQKELHNFLNKQIANLTEHSETITAQLEKNKKHIEMFKDKIK